MLFEELLPEKSRFVNWPEEWICNLHRELALTFTKTKEGVIASATHVIQGVVTNHRTDASDTAFYRKYDFFSVDNGDFIELSNSLQFLI